MKTYWRRYGSITVIALGICAIALILGVRGSRILHQMSAHEESVRAGEKVESFALQWTELMLAWDRALSAERTFVGTGTPDAISSYQRALHSVRSYFELLRVTAHGNRHLEAMIPAVEPLLKSEMQRLDAHLRAFRAGDIKSGAAGMRAGALPAESAPPLCCLRSRTRWKNICCRFMPASRAPGSPSAAASWFQGGASWPCC